MIVAVRKLVGGGFPAATPAEELITSVASRMFPFGDVHLRCGAWIGAVLTI
jgi:hypothetical protein